MSTIAPSPGPPESYRPSLYTAAIITYTLATGAVVLRFIARRLMRLAYWWDDWLIVGAWVAITGFLIVEFFWIHFGLGVHYETIPGSYASVVYNVVLMVFINDLIYSTATVLSKLSLLAFYWRIFKVTRIQWPIRIIATAAVLWLIARYIAIILHCIPVAAYWDKTIEGANCRVNDQLLFIGTNTVNFFIDLTILLLPMPYIRTLQIPRSQKIAVFAMFTLGCFIVSVSIILLIVCYRLDSTSLDITWTFSPVGLWAGTEINLLVVTACLPSLRPIFTLITKGTMLPSTAGSSRQYTSDSDGLRSKVTGLFGSRGGGRTVKTFPGTVDSEEPDHPFAIINNDRKNMLDTRQPNSREDPALNDANIGLEEVHPPSDRVMVREDYSVKYSNV